MADAARHRDRACPRDHTPLQPERVAITGPDVTLDRCPECEGVFLDKNELLRVTGDVRLNTYLRDKVGLDSDSEILCPHCGGLMDEEDAAGVTVDVCLSCFGLWLDKGELDALKARPNLEAVPMAEGKDAELVNAQRAAGSTMNPFVGLNRALGEFARRYL